jgi:hypothetical protein
METGLDELKEIVEELLDAAGITGPPVDPFAIVKVFSRRASSLPGGKSRPSLPAGEGRSRPAPESHIKKVRLPENLKGYTRKIGGLHEIYVNEDQRSERQNFTLAHEIFEIILPHQPFKERLCNLGASNLLMPDPWFREACQTTSFNLVSLKKTFSTASWEAVAYRTLAFREGVVSIVDNGKVTNRVGSMGFNYPPDPTHTERMALHQAMRTGEIVTMDQGGLTVEAYPVFEGDWKRVILVAQSSFTARA